MLEIKYIEANKSPKIIKESLVGDEKLEFSFDTTKSDDRNAGYLKIYRTLDSKLNWRKILHAN